MESDRLIDLAKEARDRAYAPYSGYRVGAALLAGSGKVYTGCNVENASYGLTICAERTAVVKAVSEGESQIVAVAVATDDGASMCGACRQVVAEFGPSAVVYLADGSGTVRETTVEALLPKAFLGKRLRKKDRGT
jgi:cytidine deaminase